jgi:hypothetical protein
MRLAGAACALALLVSGVAEARLSTRNITPFPSSRVIVGAWWTSGRLGPPANQWGDILPTIWGEDDNQYTMINDGGADVPVPGGLWRQSVARISGRPPKIRFTHVGDPKTPPPHTLQQIQSNPKIWLGPLGPYYSSGLLIAKRVLFATQQFDWNWNANGPYTGLAGIAYSFDHGKHWFPGGKPFPAPVGNLNWVIRGKGGAFLDGWAYAVGTEREFNASNLILGRAVPDIPHITDPAQWQWANGFAQVNGQLYPTWGNTLTTATPILSWPGGITYPQIAYDAPIHRYLLTFTYSYGSKPPSIWQNGAELIVMEAAHPWGPFSFVAHEGFFGPGNGYGPGFPIKWISGNGRDLWMKWSANFDGCAGRINCAGGYGFNYRKLHLRLAGDK